MFVFDWTLRGSTSTSSLALASLYYHGTPWAFHITFVYENERKINLLVKILRQSQNSKQKRNETKGIYSYDYGFVTRNSIARLFITCK